MMQKTTVLALMAYAAGCAAADGQGVEYTPGDDVRRLTFEAVPVADLAMIRDFDMAGDTLFLLDASGRVITATGKPGSLRTVATFGRHGSGPGELLQPSGITLTADGIAVLDGTRLHLFGRGGSHSATRSLTLPCPMIMPTISAGRNGMFIAGSCARRGLASDTMKAVLTWSSDTVDWEIVAEAPRYTRDGTFGSVFGARNLLTTDSSGTHVFGGGETNCYWTVTDTGGTPRVIERCPAATLHYRADPPPELKRRMRARRELGVHWPRTLPLYIDRLQAAGHVVLLRPFSTDSVVVQLAGPDPRDIAVAPLDGFVGCRAAGCLWIHDDDPLGMLIVDTPQLESWIGESH